MIPLFAVHSPIVDLMEPLRQTLASGQLAEGPKVKEFEKALEARLFHDQQRVLATNSCTSALHMAYKLAGVGPGTIVLAPPMSCFASYAPILELGGEIAWCDVSTRTGVLDVSKMRDRLRDPRVRAVLVVYWGGSPPSDYDYHVLRVACREHGVKLIIDAAHGMGLAPAYLHGDYVCFSFQAIKLINTLGDGGALLVQANEYQRARKLRWFGLDREAHIDSSKRDGRVDQDITEVGLKWHMNDMTATAGLAQLPHVAALVAKHRANALYYSSHFSGNVNNWTTWSSGTCWLYTIVTRNRGERDALRIYLHHRGIQASQAHRRCDTHTCMNKFRRPQLPGVDKFDDCALCIPVHWALTETEREYIADQVLAFYKGNV